MNVLRASRQLPSCQVPTILRCIELFFARPNFLLLSLPQMFLCKQMDQELTTTTTTKRNSSEARNACFDSRSDGVANQAHNTQRRARMAATHKQVGESNQQGAQSGVSPIGRACTTTVTAPQQGGASPSRWTRKTRPWNASTPVAVVSLFHAGPRSAIDLLSGSEESEAIAGQSREEPCGHAVRKDSRIHGSPVRV